MKYFIFGIGIIFLLLVGCQPEQQAMEETAAVAPEPAVAVAESSPAVQEPVAPPSTPTAAAVAVSDNSPAPFLMMPEVHILGRQGFDPSQVTVGVGDLVIWVNKDTRTNVLIFQKVGSSELSRSPSIVSRGTFTYNFEEAGTYEYWVSGYDVKGRVIVE